MTRARILATVTIRSLFETHEEEYDYYNHRVSYLDYRREVYDGHSLTIGSANVFSNQTLESDTFYFLVLHLGSYDLYCGIQPLHKTAHYQNFRKKQFDRFSELSLRKFIDTVERHFGRSHYLLTGLLQDDQRFVLQALTRHSFDNFSGLFSQFLEAQKKLMDYYRKHDVPLPDIFRTLMSYSLHHQLYSLEPGNSFHADSVLTAVGREARKWGVKIDRVFVRNLFESEIEESLDTFLGTPSGETLTGLANRLRQVRELQLAVDLWKPQTAFWNFLQEGDIRNFSKPEDRELLAYVCSALQLDDSIISPQ